MQLALFDAYDKTSVPAPKGQLLKWIGNKQRFAAEIISHFPRRFETYIEPFIGSGAVLASLRPAKAVASDTFLPLVEIWRTLISDPDELKQWYARRHSLMLTHGKAKAYELVRASYNLRPNGADLLFLCRACYGGVVRFRKADGFMSTPCGIHDPIPPEAFNRRADDWHDRVRHSKILQCDYRKALSKAARGDLIYCDPPYSHSQSILYGSQSFDLQQLFEAIRECKQRGALVALSIDGSKKSGQKDCEIGIPDGLFEREVRIDCGRSMLRRFQLGGQTLEHEQVADRLLLTY